MSDYVVIYEQAEDGAWGAYLPDLPGVVALGATRSEVGERIEEALAAYADDLRGRGGSLPAPHHTAGYWSRTGLATSARSSTDQASSSATGSRIIRLSNCLN